MSNTVHRIPWENILWEIDLPKEQEILKNTDCTNMRAGAEAKGEVLPCPCTSLLLTTTRTGIPELHVENTN